MPRIEVGQFATLLRRYLAMTGEAHVADELAPEVSPILTLEQERPEWEFLKGAKLMSAVFQQNGAAAQTTSARLRNPTGSGVIAIITPIVFTIGNTTEVSITRAPDSGSDLANLSAPLSVDTRYDAAVSSALRNSFTTGAGFAGSTFYSQGVTPAQTFSTVKPPFVLTPGNQIQIFTLQVQINLWGTWWWLEKRLDALERS